MNQATIDAIKLSISIIGALTGTSGLIISLFSSRREKYQVVSEFLSELSDPKFIAAKKYVYTNEASDVEDEQVAIVVNFFHHWGLLAKKKYLPMWVFDGATGRGTCRLYERTQMYIAKRRKHNQDYLYAEYFEWLYKRIKRRKKV